MNKDHHTRRVLKSEIFAPLAISLPYVFLTQHWAGFGNNAALGTNKLGLCF